MIPLDRPELSARTTATLLRRQTIVNKSPDPSDAAKKKWRTFAGAARTEVRMILTTMCSGIARCMYCEDSMGTDIDHFRPKVKYPSHCFDWNNYLLACNHCNSNQKRDAFPVRRGSPQLIDPTQEDPFDFLAFSPSTGRYVGLNAKGRETIDVFGLNRDVCTKGRRIAWVSMCALMSRYDTAQADGHHKEAADILQALHAFPFQGVLRWLRNLLRSPNPSDLIPSDVIAIARRHDELLQDLRPSSPGRA